MATPNPDGVSVQDSDESQTAPVHQYHLGPGGSPWPGAAEGRGPSPERHGWEAPSLPPGGDGPGGAEPLASLPHRNPPPPAATTDAVKSLLELRLSQWLVREQNARLSRPKGGEVEHQRRNLARLVREYRRDGGDLAGLLGPLLGECRVLGYDPEMVAARVGKLWRRTVAGQEPDAMAKAMLAADVIRVPLPADAASGETPGAADKLERMLSLAWHLGQANGPGVWFPFGLARLAAWLGSHRETVGDWVDKLEDFRLLRVRRNHDTGKKVYSSKAGLSQMVRYTGPTPALPF